MSAPTWQEIVEEYISEQIEIHDLDPSEAWAEVAQFAAENAKADEQVGESTQLVCVRDLRRNDWIVCPVSKLPEQITMTFLTGRYNRYFRTNRHDHDHIQDVNSTIERIIR